MSSPTDSLTATTHELIPEQVPSFDQQVWDSGLLNVQVTESVTRIGGGEGADSIVMFMASRFRTKLFLMVFFPGLMVKALIFTGRKTRYSYSAVLMVTSFS